MFLTLCLSFIAILAAYSLIISLIFHRFVSVGVMSVVPFTTTTSRFRAPCDDGHNPCKLVLFVPQPLLANFNIFLLIFVVLGTKLHTGV